MSDEKKRTFKSETLGLPPLQMVLVHHEKKSAVRKGATAPAPAGNQPEGEPAEDVVLRIIERLQKDK
jgi:hypothetical protein